MIKNNFKKKLDDNKFVFTAETSPPLSANKDDVLKRVLCLKDIADAVNVTDGASAKSHLSSLVVSSILSSNGIEPIWQLTTRDRNRIAIQSDLLGGWALDIKNILCIYGDQVSSGDQPEAKEVRDLDSIGVIKTAHQFKTQNTLPSGREILSSPEYFIGAADSPFEIDKDFDCKNLLNKINSGTNFFQTQFAFDYKVLANYMKRLNDFDVTNKAYYLVGLGVLKSAKSAVWMNNNLFGVNIPDNIIKRLENSADQEKEGIKICIELVEMYREIEGIHGVHLMGYHQEEQIAEVISNF